MKGFIKKFILLFICKPSKLFVIDYEQVGITSNKLIICLENGSTDILVMVTWLKLKRESIFNYSIMSIFLLDAKSKCTKFFDQPQSNAGHDENSGRHARTWTRSSRIVPRVRFILSYDGLEQRQTILQ